MNKSFHRFLMAKSKKYLASKWRNISNERAKYLRSQHPLKRNRATEYDKAIKEFTKICEENDMNISCRVEPIHQQ